MGKKVNSKANTKQINTTPKNINRNGKNNMRFEKQSKK